MVYLQHNIFKKLKNVVGCGFFQIFIGKLCKFITLKKNLFASLLSDLSVKNWVLVEKSQNTFFISSNVQKTKNTSLFFIFCFYLKIGNIGLLFNFLKYMFRHEKYENLFSTFFICCEWGYYGSFDNMLNVVKLEMLGVKKSTLSINQYFQILCFFSTKNIPKKHICVFFQIFKIKISMNIVFSARNFYFKNFFLSYFSQILWKKGWTFVILILNFIEKIFRIKHIGFFPVLFFEYEFMKFLINLNIKRLSEEMCSCFYANFGCVYFYSKLSSSFYFYPCSLREFYLKTGIEYRSIKNYLIHCL